MTRPSPPPCGGEQERASITSTSRPTRFSKICAAEPAILSENELPAGLESRSDKAPCKTHKDDLIQKLWESERTTSDGGPGTTAGITHYCVCCLPTRYASTTFLAYIVYSSKPWPAPQAFFTSSCKGEVFWSQPRPRLLSFDGLTSIANGLRGVQGTGEDFLARRWEPMDADKKKLRNPD